VGPKNRAVVFLVDGVIHAFSWLPLDTHGVRDMNATTVGEYLSIAEAALLARVSTSTIRRMIDRGQLKPCRPTPGRVVSRRALIEVIEGGTDNATMQTGAR
jgi:excisionase family DNA binding protein